jgi:hypothetical protein
MNDQGLSMYLWGEAAMTTIYVQNRSPHRILKDMTLSSGQIEWSASSGSHSFKVHSCEQF